MMRLGDIDSGELFDEGELLFAQWYSITWSCPLLSTYYTKSSGEESKGREDGQAPERLSNLLGVTQLLQGRACPQTHAGLTRNARFLVFLAVSHVPTFLVRFPPDCEFFGGWGSHLIIS